MGNEQGPLVILIHGSPGSWSGYAHLYKDPQLLEQFQLVTFDRYGYGLNRPGEPVLELDKQAAIGDALIKKYNQNGREIIVIGHSYGGPVAGKLTAMHRDKITKLILVASSMDPNLEEELWYQTIGKQRLIRWMIPDFIDVCNREIIGLKDELKQLEKNYPISVPTTIIHGKKDKLVPFDNVAYIQNHFSNTKLVVRDNMGHFVPWAFPQLIVNEIRSR